MSAVDDVFRELRAQGKKAFMPFITAGDPDLPFTRDVLCELDRRACDVVEIGIPYSDPIADGPVVQASYTRALAKHTKLTEIWQTLEPLNEQLRAPRVVMASFAIVHRVGPEKFISQAQQAGVSGVIVPDLLVEESPRMAELCRQRDFSLIQLVTPTTPRERAIRIAEASSGFLYYVSVTGITGERQALPPALAENVAWLRQRTALPICIGFGISQPEHIRWLAPVADGLIVGSAIVRRVALADKQPREQVLAEIGQFADTLLSALRESSGVSRS